MSSLVSNFDPIECNVKYINNYEYKNPNVKKALVNSNFHEKRFNVDCYIESIDKILSKYLRKHNSMYIKSIFYSKDSDMLNVYGSNALLMGLDNFDHSFKVNERKIFITKNESDSFVLNVYHGLVHFISVKYINYTEELYKSLIDIYYKVKWHFIDASKIYYGLDYVCRLDDSIIIEQVTAVISSICRNRYAVKNNLEIVQKKEYDVLIDSIHYHGSDLLSVRCISNDRRLLNLVYNKIYSWFYSPNLFKVKRDTSKRWRIHFYLDNLFIHDMEIESNLEQK